MHRLLRYCPVALSASARNMVSPPTSHRSPVGRTVPPVKKSSSNLLYNGSGLGTTVQLEPSQCITRVVDSSVSMLID
jgi:hypothetical protein